jgi:hypothetical protein
MLRYLCRVVVAITMMMLVASCDSGPTASVTTNNSSPALKALGPLEPSIVQSEVMDFTGVYVEVTGQAWDQVHNSLEARDLRLVCRKVNLAHLSGGINIAVTANPIVGLLDMIVMVELQRFVVEEYWVPHVFGETAGAPLIAAYGEVSREIWEIADERLSPQSKEQLREIVAQWRRDHPNQIYVSSVRAHDFAEARGASQVQAKGGFSIYRLFALDPLANLEPATRELIQSRLLAERAFYYARWIPLTTRLQLEVLALGVLQQPELVDLNEAMQVATERIDQIGKDLPQILADERSAALNQAEEIISTEREAALKQAEGIIAVERDAALKQTQEILARERDETVKQLFAGLEKQQDDLFARLNEDNEGMTTLLSELRSTVESGTQLSNSVQSNFDAITAMMDRSEAGRSGDAASSPQYTPEDISMLLASMTETIDQANRLTESLIRILESPTLSDAGQIQLATDRVFNGLVDRIFWRGLILIIVALAGALAVGMMLRRVPRV